MIVYLGYTAMFVATTLVFACIVAVLAIPVAIPLLVAWGLHALLISFGVWSNYWLLLIGMLVLVSLLGLALE